MKIERFEMERFQSTWEHTVEFNLADSGVLPLTLAGLVDHTWVQEVLAHEPIGYGMTNGSLELRTEIAGLYHAAGPEHVLVTSGSAEANFLVTWALLQPGDEAVVMLPNYMQIPLLIRGLGAEAKTWWLTEANQWGPDLDDLARLVTPRTKAIFVCNPNNPTGAVLTIDAMNAICEMAAKVNAWVVADEVYRGGERDGHTTPSFWARYARALVTGGMSKVFGLPGLRIGWIVGPHDMIDSLWGYHDYTTISPNFIGDRLALMALTPRTRQRLALRAQSILSENFLLLSRWVDDLEGVVTWTPPQAGAIAFLRYHPKTNSTELATRLRREHDVLVVPGDHFQMDGFIRVGFGGERRLLEEGLRRTGDLLRSLR